MLKPDLIRFLRKSLGVADFTETIFEIGDWTELHEFAERQSIIGLCYSGMCLLPENCRPPKNLFFRWGMEAEAIRGLNKKMNSVACRLTDLFSNHGCQSAILKGQANALLYPDPSLRQSGDIDIWVEGGRNKVLEILSELNLQGCLSVGEHDISIPATYFGFIVEVHFLACSGNRNPFSNRRLQDFLKKELEYVYPCSEKSKKIFNVPSKKFALVMQLSHIQRHFLTVGIGLRQIIDYYFLLKASTVQDRKEVSSQLKKFGLSNIASALMWVLQELFLLEDQFLLCAVDVSRGKRLLQDVLEGGDFGQYSKRTKGSAIIWWIKGKFRLLSLLRYDFMEVSWQLLRYIPDFIFKFPNKLRLIHKIKVGNR